MKKLVSLCLLIALLCSICVTGVSASALSSEEIMEKYGALIEALEAEDYDAATEEFVKLLPEPETATEPDADSEPVTDSGVSAEKEVIELTVDNFFDYFEFVQRENSIERDSSGKIKSIYPGWYQLVLKEEYRNRYSWESGEITVGFIAKVDSYYRAKIDWETGEVTLGDKASKDIRKAIKKNCKYSVAKQDSQVTGYDSFYICSPDFFYLYRSSGFKWWTTGAAEPGKDTKYYTDTWNVEVVNVSGTLILDPA